jgi:DNA-binding response OmpR family regulator
LVVDDEVDICRQLREALETEGWEVHACSDGAQAIEAAHTFCPTVVVLDLRMPKKDGLEVQTWLSEQRPWTPVIILTGHGTEEDAIRCCNLHAFQFLRKPVSPLEIVRECETARASYPDPVVAFFHWYAALPDPNKVVYQTASGRNVSASELNDEVQRQSPTGREFIRRVTGVAVELVMTRL